MRVSTTAYPELPTRFLQYDRVVRIDFFAFADEDVEAEFQQHFANVMACFDARCLTVGIIILYLNFLKVWPLHSDELG